MELEFESPENQDGIEIIDPIERHRYTLHTPEDISWTSVGVDQFLFPVDAAVSLTTETITLPSVVPIYVRNSDAEMVAETEHFACEELPVDEYSIEICAPIKLYLSIDSEVTVTADIEQTQIDFGTPTQVFLGGRSRHKHPATTITTTEDPGDIMAAVSTLSSALKTTSPERSYPTLRGHPPTIEIDNQLRIPSSVDPPDTGIEITVPPDLQTIYVTASLAYYLGADLIPGEPPRISTDTGFEHRLDTSRGFESEVERILKQVFFLDCVTRTEGYYPVDLHEREAIESEVAFDFANLYEQPLTEQLQAYLTVPFNLVENHLPDWKLTTHIDPLPKSVEVLPFVVNDLAVIRSTDNIQHVSNSQVEQESVSTFLRNDVLTRSTATDSHDGDQSYVQPNETDSLEHAWIGDSTPIGASKLTKDAFQHRHNRTATDGNISITVVCNDEEMEEEWNLIDDVYGDRDDLPFEVTVKQDLTTDHLREVLGSQIDFLHYIGHIEKEGIQCKDGKLDTSTLDTVGVDAFLLNACNSYAQGMGLIEAGAIGGVVTLSEVINSGAVRIGSSMARLLNSGFPLRAALTIARDESIVGGQYIVVGDGGLTVVQPGAIPNLLKIESTDDGFDVNINTYATDDRGLGSLFMPYLNGITEHFLTSGSLQTFHISEDELNQFLQLEDVPVRIDGSLYWSQNLNVDEL